MSITLWRAATWAGGPFIRSYLGRRLDRGKEDRDRFGERLGIASGPRPDGPLVWLHAASVGESLSMLSLIDRLRRERPEITLLMTSGTVTSAALLRNRLPDEVIHQFVPVDRPPWVRRFLDHWRPDLALWVESEFWPTMLSEIRRRGIPALLVNARISARSWRGWRRAPWMIRRLLATFDTCMAQTELDAERLRDLGAQRVACPGNLKFAAAALPADAASLEAMEAVFEDRPRWLAFSTHPGEETILLEAHKRMAAAFPDLLTVIVPRHVARGGEIAARARAAGLDAVQRSNGHAPEVGTAVYVADTMGELGLFFRLTGVAFVGGTLVPHGGQNPIEPARLGCAIVHGPHMENFLAVEAELKAAGASAVAATAEEIAREVGMLLAGPTLRQRRVSAARAVAEGKANILDAVFAQIDPYLNRVAPTRPLPAARDARA